MPAARQACLVGEGAAAVDEDLGLVHQVRAAGFDQRDQRQLVLCGQFLCTQGLLQTHGCDGTALHGAVAGADQHPLAGHRADAHDAAATEHALFAVVVVHAQACQRAEFQETAAAVDDPRHAFARQQLPARVELLA